MTKITNEVIERVFKQAIERHNALAASQRGYDIWTSFEVIEIKNQLLEEILLAEVRAEKCFCHYPNYHDLSPPYKCDRCCKLEALEAKAT